MFGRGPLVKAAGKAMENKLFEVVPWLLVLEWYHIAGSWPCTLLAFNCLEQLVEPGTSVICL